MLFPNLIPVSPFGDKVFLACLPRSSSYVSLSCVFFKALPKFHLSRLHLPPNHLYSYLPNRVQSYSAIHFLPYRRFDGFLDSCVQFGSEKTGGKHLKSENHGFDRVLYLGEENTCNWHKAFRRTKLEKGKLSNLDFVDGLMLESMIFSKKSTPTSPPYSLDFHFH